jgi:hypothetical protein
MNIRGQRHFVCLSPIETDLIGVAKALEVLRADAAMVNLNAHEAGNGGESPRNTYSPSCFPLLGDGASQNGSKMENPEESWAK